MRRVRVRRNQRSAGLNSGFLANMGFDDVSCAGNGNRDIGADANSCANEIKHFPPRPSIPAVLALALGMWLACAITYSTAANIESNALVIVGCAGCAASVVVAAFWLRLRKLQLVFALLLGVLLGVSLGSVAAIGMHAKAENACGENGTWYCQAIEDGSAGDYGASVFARVKRTKSSPDSQSAVVKVTLSKDCATPRFGDEFCATGTIKEAKESQAAYFWRKSAVGSLRAYNVEMQTPSGIVAMLTCVRNKAIDAFSTAASIDSGLTSAIICGYRESLDDGVYRNFQTCGLAHVVAVSGAHLSIVAAFAARALRALRARKFVSTALQIAFILSYLVLCAVPISALRAAIMTTAGLLSWSFKRRGASLNALAVCIIAIIATDPASAVSTSFALSALSTLGIVLFGSWFVAWVQHFAPHAPGFIVDALALTGASSVLSLPLSVAMFSQLPLISALANIVVTPLFGPVCIVGILGGVVCVAFPQVIGFIAPIVANVSSSMVWCVNALSCVPYASIPFKLDVAFGLLVSVLLAAWLWWAWLKPSRRVVVATCFSAAVLVAVYLFVAPYFTPCQLIALDVGQGDAILLRSYNSAVLVDTGNQDSKLKEALARHGVSKLDAVVITHPDDDHMGSLESLKAYMQINSVVVAADVFNCSCNSCKKLCSTANSIVGEGRVAGIHSQDTLTFGKWQAQCVWPSTFTDEGGNADSLCFVASAQSQTGFFWCSSTSYTNALLVGDAESSQIQALLDSNQLPEIDLYKVGHHGSKKALTDEQAQALHPAISLISVGANNRYGHPAAAILDALGNAGSEIVRTDKSGDITCEFSAGSISVSTTKKTE